MLKAKGYKLKVKGVGKLKNSTFVILYEVKDLMHSALWHEILHCIMEDSKKWLVPDLFYSKDFRLNGKNFNFTRLNG